MKRRSLGIADRTLLALATATMLTLAAPAQAQPGPVHLVGGIAAEGGALVDRTQGLLGGAGVHLGVHFFGVEIFGLAQGLVGALVMGPHGGEIQGVLWNSAMLGFGVEFLHFALGPSLDFAWGCTDQVGDARCYDGGPLAGIDGRLALVFGALSLSVDVHPTFYRGGTVTGLVAGIGLEL